MTREQDNDPVGFAPGDRVRIVAGSFVGMLGTIITPDEATRLVPGAFIGPEVGEGKAYWLTINVFGHEVPIELWTEQLMRA